MENNWQQNSVLAGYGTDGDLFDFLPGRFLYGAAILPTDHLFTLGWRTVYLWQNYFGRVPLLSSQGAGTYPEVFALVPGSPPPHFPFGVTVSGALFPS